MQKIDYSKSEIFDVEFLPLEVNKEASEKYTKTMFGKEEWIDVDKIKIDIKVQRELQETHAKKIASKFDPAAFGRPVVTLRNDGFYYCNDGSHRLAALKILGITKCPCIVIDLQSLQEEGLNFININEQSAKVNAIDKYRIGVHSGVESWLRVKEVVDFANLEVGTGNDKLNCVGIIHKYVNGPKVQTSIEKRISAVKTTLLVLKKCYGVDGITGIMFQSMFTIVNEYVVNGMVTSQQLINVLSKGSNHKVFATKAYQMRENNNGRGKVISYIAYLILVEYNNGVRKKDKLPIMINI